MKLITAIKIQAKCETERELKDLSRKQKIRLAYLIEERVPSGLATIDEWNEAISYFEKRDLQTDNEKAKSLLLSILRKEEI